MRLLERLNAVLAYIEEHLCEELDTREMAKLAACSVATLQRTFATMLEMPLSEYIRGRRLTQAAYALQNSNAKVIDVALDYGYDSPESFARAFRAMHSTTPSGARLVGTVLTAQPPITLLLTVKGATPMEYKIVQKEAFDVYGIERAFETANGENFKKIPAFWDEMLTTGRHDALAMSTHAPKNALCPVNGMCTDRKDLPGGQIRVYAFCLCYRRCRYHWL